MRHWDSPAAIVRMTRSSQSLTWPSSVGATTELFTLPPPTTQKSSPWRTLQAKHSNPDHITSFIIFTMKHWDSPAVIVRMKRSSQSPTWPSSVGATTELFTLPTLKIQDVETLAGKAFQSRPHYIIHHIQYETLGQSSSNS
eukprot:scaffold81357_cov57-Cyclotella_meneghiniana.AAC.1